MKPRFDLDGQRIIICTFALVALGAEIIGIYLTGRALPDTLNGILLAMAAGPVLERAAGKWFEYRRERRTEEADSDSPPPPPASSPDPSRLEEEGKP